MPATISPAPARFTRPLYLAKPLGQFTSAPAFAPQHAGEVTRGLLIATLASQPTPEEVITKATTLMGRNLGFDFSAAYAVEADSADRLTLLGSQGLPQDFLETGRALPLWDFADVADLPYNEHCRPCYGDFFAPVAATYGMRSWLVASLRSPQSGAVRGAILLGSRQPERLGVDEAASVLSLAITVSDELAARFPSL